MLARRLSYVAAFVLVAGMIPAASGINDADFKPGQMWSMHSSRAKVIIGIVEPWKGTTVVHVSVTDIPVPGRPAVTKVAHMPIEKIALSASVDKLLAPNVPVPPDFQEGYEKWRRDRRAGIFTIPVAQAIQLIFGAISPSQE